MTLADWSVFAGFWLLFVTTPGPNAANCIRNGMTLPMPTAMLGVLAILTQATVFLMLSAAGVAALIVAAPDLFFWARLIGAGVLIWLGIRAWRRAGQLAMPAASGRGVYGQALLIATVNAKSLSGYLAAFTQFVAVDVPIWEQMVWIMPTALPLTALSYTGYTLLGAVLGRAAIGALAQTWVQRVLAACFLAYGGALGASTLANVR